MTFRDQSDVVEFGSGRRPRRPWLVPSVVGVALVAAGAVALSQATGHHRHPKPARPPAAAVTVTKVGPHLLGIHAGWELFARGSDKMVAIQPAAGRITTTRVPRLGSDSPEVAFILGAHDAIIRSFDEVPGYVIPDGKPVRRLTGPLAARVPGPL